MQVRWLICLLCAELHRQGPSYHPTWHSGSTTEAFLLAYIFFQVAVVQTAHALVSNLSTIRKKETHLALVVNGNALMPVHADEIQGKSLGMAVDVFDPLSTEGESLEMTDEPGELVCTAPFPSQPLTFWGSGGSEKYRNAYFSMFGDKVWVQGDLIRINKDTKGIQMLGRS